MNMDALPERLPYDHAKFVDRDAEVRLVLDKARSTAAGFEDKRVVIFHGARGAGKSWLLQEINYQLGQALPNVLTLYLDLFDFSNSPPNDAVQAIIGQIRKVIGNKLALPPSEISPAVSLDSLAEALVEDARRVGVLILLFDYVDESPRDMLALLEDRCLAPLAVLPQTLIVLAGRGREYMWKAMELRIKSEERDLQSFDLTYTREQLEKQIPPQPVPAAHEIYPLSAGYPWSNYLLGKDFANRAAALEECVVALIGSGTQKLVRPYAEALCVLRSFDESRMPAMFSAYFGQPANQWARPDCHDIRGQLIEAFLARWDLNSGMFVLDAAIKTVLENALFESRREVWIKLHCAAYCLYKDRASRYPRTASRWQAEADYHASRLKAAGYNPDKCECSGFQSEL